MGQISRDAENLLKSVEYLEKSQRLLGEIMATFAINRERLKWTGDELRKLYEFHDQSWLPRFSAIESGSDTNDAYKTATEKLFAYLLTVKRENTREWFSGLVDEVNAWAEATGERDRVELCGDGLRIAKESEAV